MITHNYQIIWEYHFAYRELAVLLRNDQALHKRYLEVHQHGYQGLAALIAAFVASGVLSLPSDDQELSAITELCWLVSEQWPVNLELSGRSFDAQGIMEGTALMRWVLRPLLIQ